MAHRNRWFTGLPINSMVDLSMANWQCHNQRVQPFFCCFTTCLETAVGDQELSTAAAPQSWYSSRPSPVYRLTKETSCKLQLKTPSSYQRCVKMYQECIKIMYPLVNKRKLLKMAIEIVDLPIKSGNFP